VSISKVKLLNPHDSGVLDSLVISGEKFWKISLFWRSKLITPSLDCVKCMHCAKNMTACVPPPPPPPKSYGERVSYLTAPLCMPIWVPKINKLTWFVLKCKLLEYTIQTLLFYIILYYIKFTQQKKFTEIGTFLRSQF
jgi:hypothetical protein